MMVVNSQCPQGAWVVCVEFDESANLRLFTGYVTVEASHQRSDERLGGGRFALGWHGLLFQPDCGGAAVCVEAFQSGEGVDCLDGPGQGRL